RFRRSGGTDLSTRSGPTAARSALASSDHARFPGRGLRGRRGRGNAVDVQREARHGGGTPARRQAGRHGAAGGSPFRQAGPRGEGGRWAADVLALVAATRARGALSLGSGRVVGLG